jgi:glutathione S-transferase
LSASPLAKIPFVLTEQGALRESQAILDYIEAAWPTQPLLPADAWGRAKVHGLTLFIDAHLEPVARELYPQAFFGGSVSKATRDRVHKRLLRNIAAFRRLARFGGAEFTQADCAAYVSLPLIGLSSKLVYGEDVLLAAGVDWKAYVKLIASRPSAQKVDADRKADQERRTAAARAAT